jgi:putative methionine-R-sulfoxide reductase with GAF domain
MSKFDLRDISDRLSRSRDTEAVVFEFLGYLQAVRPDWRATLAFYEVSRDALVSVYARQGQRLVRRDIDVPVDRLPARLVRKFFHPSAFFNPRPQGSVLARLFGASPSYEAVTTEAAALAPVAPLATWESCLCLPIADQDDVFGLLVLASDKKGAFGGSVVGDLLPVKSMAALALSHHLWRAARDVGTPPPEPANGTVEAPAAGAAFQDKLQKLNAHATALELDNRAKAQQLAALAGEIEQLDKSSTRYQQELERVKSTLFALEEQSAAATHHLTEAYSELNVTRVRMTELQRTVRFMKEAGQLLGEEHDAADLPRVLVEWFCEHFRVDRCSMMLLDPQGETLSIAAHRGLAAGIAKQVRVRLGQGIAGWVAHNRKPLFVRVREDAGETRHTDREVYNSDSFICVPLVYNGRLSGVLNLSNKRDAEPFDAFDLDRALLAAVLVATVLGGHELARRANAWA